VSLTNQARAIRRGVVPASAKTSAREATGPDGTWEAMLEESRRGIHDGPAYQKAKKAMEEHNRRFACAYQRPGVPAVQPGDSGPADSGRADDSAAEIAPESPDSDCDSANDSGEPEIRRLRPPLVTADFESAPEPGYLTAEEHLLAQIGRLTEDLKHSAPPRLPRSDPGYDAREQVRVAFFAQQRTWQAERARLNEELLRVQGRLERGVRESDPHAGRVINHRPGRPDTGDDAPVGGRSSWDIEDKGGRGRGRSGFLDY
jgi:hypothetical protein